MDIDLYTARTGFLICSGITVLCAILSKLTEIPLFFVLTVLGVFGMLFFQFFIRCPSCGRSFGRFHTFAEYCPYCGEHL